MDLKPSHDMPDARARALTLIEWAGLGEEDLPWALAAVDPSIDLAKASPRLLEDPVQIIAIFAAMATTFWAEGYEAGRSPGASTVAVADPRLFVLA